VTSKRGFTVLEMVVATTIMGIAIVGLLTGIASSARNAAHLREYGRAVQLARLRMNELLVDPRLPRDIAVAGPYDPALSGGLDAGWQARLTSFEMSPITGPGQMALDRIELQIWWMAGTHRRTFSLEGFRPRVLKQEDFVPGSRQ
jgi:general secretion pathway protein I